MNSITDNRTELIFQRQTRFRVLFDWLRGSRTAAPRVDHHLGGGQGDAGVHDQPEGRLPQAEGAAGDDQSRQEGARGGEGIAEKLSGKLPTVHVRPVPNVRLTRGLGHNFILRNT